MVAGTSGSKKRSGIEGFKKTSRGAEEKLKEAGLVFNRTWRQR